MFIFGTDGESLRAWPLHTIASVSYNAAGSARAGGRPELAIYLTNETIVWLRGDEAEAVWSKITAQGYGWVRPKA